MSTAESIEIDYRVKPTATRFMRPIPAIGEFSVTEKESILRTPEFSCSTKEELSPWMDGATATDQHVSKEIDELHDKFEQLATEWKSDMAFSSSVAEMSAHLAYQQIIGMGPPVVPLILRRLETNPDHWFWALYVITNENPVPEEASGRVSDMANAWVQWGREEGLL